MEFGAIEREIFVAAAPEVVFDVVSRPEHVQEWWPDEAELEPTVGATGVVRFGETKVVPLTVVEAEPPKRFSFRWVYDAAEVPTAANSLLATFELIPSGAGTLLRFSETGFDESSTSDEDYRDHITGWDYFLPRLAPYVDRLVSTP